MEQYREITTENGYTNKIVKSSVGKIEIRILRGRNASFEPHFLKKDQTLDPELKDRLLFFCSTGTSTKKVAENLGSFYGQRGNPRSYSVYYRSGPRQEPQVAVSNP